jgi:dTDP-4-dehydrorhamnose reductase
MLGHKLFQTFSREFETHVTVQHDYNHYRRLEMFDRESTSFNVDAQNLNSVSQTIAAVKPDVIVNCIGIVKQLTGQNDPLSSIMVNASFPHSLAKICVKNGIRLIAIGTDCVFSGKLGNYTEEHPADPTDWYGHTKYLGEVNYPGCLTIRTSLIGRQLFGSYGLMEWLLSQRGKQVKGYRQAIFSGFTTQALSRYLIEIIKHHQQLEGIRHLSSSPISKHDLLCLLNDGLQLNIDIQPDDTVICNRSLDAGRFEQETKMSPPAWPEMIEQFKADKTAYDNLHSALTAPQGKIRI